ncbi:MAG: phosphoribosyltransferase family protein [Gammaproteobacteria bacterium]|nr:phosphoribosyltransferase family protein [Gammaproteobacteria bacterium]
MELPIADRTTAGQSLGEALTDYAGRDDVLVLALPRGGLPVAYEVARRIDAPLDVMIIGTSLSPNSATTRSGATWRGHGRNSGQP